MSWEDRRTNIRFVAGRATLAMAFGITSAASGWCNDQTPFTVYDQTDSTGWGHTLEYNARGRIDGTTEEGVVEHYCQSRGG